MIRDVHPGSRGKISPDPGYGSATQRPDQRLCPYPEAGLLTDLGCEDELHDLTLAVSMSSITDLGREDEQHDL